MLRQILTVLLPDWDYNRDSQLLHPMLISASSQIPNAQQTEGTCDRRNNCRANTGCIAHGLNTRSKHNPQGQSLQVQQQNCQRALAAKDGQAQLTHYCQKQ